MPTRHTALFYARLSGLLYLINIACGLFGEIFVRSHLIVPADPAATAHNIAAHELLFRLGIAGDLVMHLTDVPTAILFYLLLKPVSRNLSALAALFGLLQTAALIANKLNLATALLYLSPSAPNIAAVRAFTPTQLQALASVALEQHELGFAIGLIFFAFSCLLTGYLLYRSHYFPRVLGLLQIMAGVSYLINSFTLLLVPTLAAKLFPAIVAPAFVGELLTCLYLLTRGLNPQAWRDRTGTEFFV